MKNKNKGFTLIEILVVIAIIGIISALALVIVSALKNKARKAKVEANLQDFIKVAIMAQGETGKYLINITGSGCSDCGWCPGAGASCVGIGRDQIGCRNNKDLKNISEDDCCFKCWKQAVTNIQNASGGGIQLNINKYLRDPWGSPYLLDENEGEGGGTITDKICSAGPDGYFYGSRDKENICFAIPRVKPK